MITTEKEITSTTATTTTTTTTQSFTSTSIDSNQDSSTTACVPTDFYYSAISFYCTICFKMTTMVLNNYSITDASTYFKTVYCPKVGLFKKRCLKAVQSLLDPLRTQLAPECEGESVETTVSFFCQNVVGMCYLQDNSYDCPSYVLGIPNLKDQIVQRQHDEL